ncbi:glucose dehydrogenase [FAD, quinone]-like [Armigeres subalbatus]|uniref:glucose dehydrogenase [FAD, quinone]-like n=1 Tax=Armigeres subalbatus TaxID=124917 RepID=UPI002ED110A7
MVYELRGTNIDWEYKALRSRRHSLSSVAGASWPRGLVLGGSGTIGTMKYERGNRRDYDNWEQLGNVGWSWKDVIKYFKKSENNNAWQSSKLHGTKGFLFVDNYESLDPLNRIVMTAANELGFENINDLSIAKNLGIGWAQFMVENRTRCSSAKAFLSTIRHRKNLHVMKHAFVTSISFTGDNVARGVNFILRNKHSLRAMARKEIVISAGAVNTPKLLLLSGIGRKVDLAPFNISLRANLNVGYNLQDHVAIPLFYKFSKLSQSDIYYNLEKVLNLFDFALKNRSQPLTSHHMAGLTLNLNTHNASGSFADAQVVYQPFKKGGFTSYSMLRKMGYNHQVVKSIQRIEQEADVVMAMICVLNPQSRGVIKLVTADPYQDPAIKAAYFNEYEDLKTLVRAIKIHQQMLTTNSFRNSGAQLHRLNIPACQFIQYATDEYWECYIRHVSVSMYHPAGTTKMGPDDDPEAVVDSRLKVKQVANLRILDASIMPRIVSGGLTAPTIMIAEKGADMVKEDTII